MFSSVSSEVYSFQSNWKRNCSTKEFTTQTDTYKIIHRGLNIKKHRSSECQTDSYLYVEEDIHPDVDESELNTFIKKVVPRIYKVLLSNERSNAFNIPQTVNGDIKESMCLYKIENKTDEFGVKNVSQLSWNCNGTVLAAAFGDIIHNKWCVHTNTGIGIFSLSARNKKFFEDKPDTMLETTTCACCVQFHYYMTSLIVAGTHNGEIVVWDRSRAENDLILASSSENKVHQEPINSILWSNVSGKTVSSNYCLVSLGNDGTIVMWNLSMRKSTLIPLNRYTLTARDLPKSIRYRGSLSKSLSILCGSLNPNDNEYLVIGSEIGVLFLCNIKLKSSSSSIGNELQEIKSPTESVLATISGAVHGVQWSKLLANFVAAISATGIIYIYNVEHKQQISAIEPGQGYLYDLSLSPLIPGLIVTSGENGTLVLMNFLENNLSFTSELKNLDHNSEDNISKPEYTVLKCNELNTREDSMIINCVEFNEQNIGYVAASDINGTIYIWQLSQNLTENRSKNPTKNSEIHNQFSNVKK